MDNNVIFPLDKITEFYYNIDRSESELVLLSGTDFGNTGSRWPLSALLSHLKYNISQVLYNWNRIRAGIADAKPPGRKGLHTG